MSWKDVYERNKKLDEFFEMKYFDQVPNYFEKNCLELCVEIAEAANESKCFKYWSIKECDREACLEEIADCFLMTLYFFRYLGLEIELMPVGSESNDLVVIFNQLFQFSSCLMNDCDSQIVKKIFVCLEQVGMILGFTEKEMIDSCLKKIKKNEDRLRSNDY